MDGNGASRFDFAPHIARIYELLWKPLLDAAKKNGEKHCEIEIGAPRCPVSEGYLAAGAEFLAKKGVPNSPVLVQGRNGAPTRLVLRVLV